MAEDIDTGEEQGFTTGVEKPAPKTSEPSYLQTLLDSAAKLGTEYGKTQLGLNKPAANKPANIAPTSYTSPNAVTTAPVNWKLYGGIAAGVVVLVVLVVALKK